MAPAAAAPLIPAVTYPAGTAVAVAGAAALAAPTAGPGTMQTAAWSMPAGYAGPPLDPIPPAVPPAFPLNSPAEAAAAAAWAAGLPQRPPAYGTPEDQAYQVRVAGAPERQLTGVNGGAVWADGFRPADGAVIDAKHVREQGCSSRTLDRLTQGDWYTGMVQSTQDVDEFRRYQAAIDDPAGHARFLEVDTNDSSTVGYWQYILAQAHVSRSDVRYVP